MSPDMTLTTTEGRLLHLVAAGLSPDQIAELLRCDRTDLAATMGAILAKLRQRAVTR